jgi:hypothetical protein
MTPLDLGATPFAPLSAHLLDLLQALEGKDIPLILVGGFGLFLRRQLAVQGGSATLYEVIPEPRATEDLDFILKLQLLADLSKMAGLRATLDGLGYEVIESAKEYQFRKPGTVWGSQRNVKIDLMARSPEEGDPKLHIGGRRLMPKKQNNPLHAFRTPEAIAVEENLQEVALSGLCTSSESYTGTIYLPASFALFLMKLFAFRDEQIDKKGPNREQYARKHAIDLYTISALLTVEEYDMLPTYREKYGSHPVAQEAKMIVSEYFARRDSPGAIRLQEHPDFPSVNQLEDFLSLLAEIFI